MKMKFIKDKDMFADLEECFGDHIATCLRLARTGQQIMKLLDQLGRAVKPARASMLKRKLGVKLRELTWNHDGRSCETYEREIETLRSIVWEAIGLGYAPSEHGKHG